MQGKKDCPDSSALSMEFANLVGTHRLVRSVKSGMMRSVFTLASSPSDRSKSARNSG